MEEAVAIFGRKINCSVTELDSFFDENAGSGKRYTPVGVNLMKSFFTDFLEW